MEYMGLWGGKSNFMKYENQKKYTGQKLAMIRKYESFTYPYETFLCKVT